MAKRGRKSRAEQEEREILIGTVEERPDDADPGEAIQPLPEGFEPVGAGVCVPETPYPTEAIARVALGLEPEHVLTIRVDGASVVLVTRGGMKLTWPQDIARARALTQAQKDGQWPGGKAPNVRAWNEPTEEKPKG
jgi:hypothetical protein